MTERESDVVVRYLHAGRTDWTEKLTKAMLRVWYDGLKVFPFDLAQAWMPTYFGARDPKRDGFPPELGEVVHALDRFWEIRQERQREQALLEADAVAKRLLTGPVEAWGDAKTLAAQAVALVRALMEGTITPGSPEHQAAQAAVQALARVGVAPCCDKRGVTGYQVQRHGSLYAYAARCDCPRGLASAYMGFPVVDRSRGTVEPAGAMR